MLLCLLWSYVGPQAWECNENVYARSLCIAIGTVTRVTISIMTDEGDTIVLQDTDCKNFQKLLKKTKTRFGNLTTCVDCSKNLRDQCRFRSNYLH